MTRLMVVAIGVAMIGAVLGACGGNTTTVSAPATDTTATDTTATDTTATDTTATDTTDTDATTTPELSQSDLSQQIAACVVEKGGNPKIDTLGDRVTIAARLGPDHEPTIFAVLTDGRNAQNFSDKLLADGADPASVFYSEEQPVVTYFPAGPPSKSVLETANYCVYEYEL